MPDSDHIENVSPFRTGLDRLCKKRGLAILAIEFIVTYLTHY